MDALAAPLPPGSPLDGDDQVAQRLAAIVECSDDAILSKDLNGIILSWNAGAERLFGYKPDEIVGKSVTILIPEDQPDEEPRILERIGRGELIDHYQTVRKRKDGLLIDVSLSVSPIRDASGKVIGASKIARDISEHKRSEQVLTKRIEELAALYRFTDRLHRSRALRDVYDAALDAIQRALGCQRASILLFDGQGVMRFVAWRGLSDDYREAVEGHSPWTREAKDPDPIHIDDVAASDLPDVLKERLASEHIGAAAFIPLVANGRLAGKFMVYHAAPHRFTHDELDLALTIARQLGFGIERLRAEDARRRAEDSLRESEERLQLALTSGTMGAWEWDIGTGAVIWSPSLEEIHGIEPGSFGGRFEDFSRDIHPDDLPMVLARIEAALASKEDYDASYRITTSDGSVKWLEAFGRVVVDEAGAPRKLAGICMDITARRMAEAQRELLVAELSHRVKNTLATVVSIAQQSFHKDRGLEEGRNSFAARIRALAQTHGRLAEASWTGVSLATMLADELAPYRGEDESNFRLEGPTVMLSPKHALTLGMAIHELATNAAKYGALSSKTGSVEVAWTISPERRLQLRWTESGGPGVAPPDRSGFGRLLLERALASDLRGDVRLDFAPQGLICEIEVPLETQDRHPT